MTKLLGCPFCGEPPENCLNITPGHPEMHWILCRNCHASPGDRPTQEEAIAAWNTRALSSTRDDVLVTDALILALEPFNLLATGVNMNDPLSKWFTMAQFQDARDAIEAALKGRG
jgi:Lar family restriction alleviation protein